METRLIFYAGLADWLGSGLLIRNKLGSIPAARSTSSITTRSLSSRWGFFNFNNHKEQIMIQKHNEESLEQLLQEHEEVVVRFSAEWCGPCKQFAPAFTEVALDHSNDKTIFIVIDADAQRDLANKYGVRGLPSVVFFLHGQKVGMVSGAMSTEKFRDVVNKQFNR